MDGITISYAIDKVMDRLLTDGNGVASSTEVIAVNIIRRLVFGGYGHADRSIFENSPLRTLIIDAAVAHGRAMRGDE